MSTKPLRMKDCQTRLWAHIAVLCSLFVTSQGYCELPASWSGEWFQLGSGKPSLSINKTHIETKGQCIETEGDKFIFRYRAEQCSRCIVMHKKHNNVLQYKETYCVPDTKGYPMRLTLCDEINGDATLLSMFRTNAQGIPCPFKSPPFGVVYSKGHGECGSPPSRAEQCTDETRLVFRFQACPDIPGTESAVEELECLATWREGTIHYLVGKLHHKMAMIDEEKYRCFVYVKDDHTYQVAQSGEATCSGLLTPYEGSRNMKLTKTEWQHNRCKFPTWVTQHYHWRSLDDSHSFHFSHHNATLKIDSSTGYTETKVMCYNIDMEKGNVARIVVHVISGCDGGYKCMTLHKRDYRVIEMQQSDIFADPAEACRSTMYETVPSTKSILMLTAFLPPSECPLEGKYNPNRVEPEIIGDCSEQTGFQQLRMACAQSRDTIDFEPICSTNPKTSYLCRGSWRENGTTYVIGSPVNRQSTEARHYCFVFKPGNGGVTIDKLPETCSLSVRPSELTFNVTEIGKCSETSSGLSLVPGIAALIVTSCLFHALIAR